MSDSSRLVDTPGGPARLHVFGASSPVATLVLGHGAGGGVTAPDLAALARELPARGIEVVLVEQPWRVRGRRVAGSPASLDAAWVAVIADLRSGPARAGSGAPRCLVLGGRSAGARVAARTVGTTTPTGLVLLAFPLRPPRRGAASRVAELADAARAVPTVVVQGTRDAFGSARDVRAALAELAEPLPGPVPVVPVEAADHAFAVLARSARSRDEVLGDVVGAVAGAVLGMAGRAA